MSAFLNSNNLGPKLESLVKRWHAEAEMFRRRGQDATAALIESFVTELEASLHEWDLESLTLQEATKESGYSYSALQKMVGKGRLPNVGDKNRPRVRRGDLPRKPSRSTPVQDESVPDLASTILANRV